MKPTVKVVVHDNSAKVAAAFKELSQYQVYVGIPEKSTVRKKGVAITNAQLAFIHTHGVRNITMRTQVRAKMINKQITFQAATALYLKSKGSPLMDIPPRPIIEPAIEEAGNKAAITKELGEAAKSTLDGNKVLAMQHLNRAGLEAQNRVRAWFTDPRNKWAPNAPSTIKRKGSSKPLIDTGELRKSITYVVGKKGD